MPTANDFDADQADREVATLLGGVRRLGVAFSGGVDSSVLLALAVRVLGPGSVVAILGVSPSLAGDERRSAHDVAAFIGAEVIEVVTHEGSPGPMWQTGRTGASIARTNSSRRSATNYCKSIDSMRSPTARTPMTPNDPTVPAHGRQPTIGCYDRWPMPGGTSGRCGRSPQDSAYRRRAKPAAPCLASRIPHYQAVTPIKLRQIEEAETSLRALGFSDLRVRHHGEIARIELPPDELVTAVTEPMRSSIREAMQSAGFRFAVVDLAGVQSGAFTLPLVQINHG